MYGNYTPEGLQALGYSKIEVSPPLYVHKPCGHVFYVTGAVVSDKVLKKHAERCQTSEDETGIQL